jgi:hypothetical protein
VIQPSFAALFRSSEILSIGLNVQGLAKFAPPQPIMILLNEFFKELILLMNPLFILIVLFQQITGLILKQYLLFVGKQNSKEFPIVISLIGYITTIWLMSMLLEKV